MGLEEVEAGITQAHQETLGCDGMFVTMIVVVVSRCIVCQTCHVVCRKYVKCIRNQLYINTVVLEVASGECSPIPFLPYFPDSPTKARPHPMLFLKCSWSFVMAETQMSLFPLEVKEVF